MTDARAVQRSTVATPTASIPCSTSASGDAPSPDTGSTSWPSRVRLCQKSAEASSRLSKKSSSEYRPDPQLVKTEWYRDPPPGAGHAEPRAQIGTIAGVYTTPKSTARARNTPAVTSSVAKLPSRGRRCWAGHSVVNVELGSVVWKIVSCTRIVGGLSHTVRVVVRLPPKSCVAARQDRDVETSSVTAMLSSFRYSSASTRVLNVWSHCFVKFCAKLGSVA